MRIDIAQVGLAQRNPTWNVDRPVGWMSGYFRESCRLDGGEWTSKAPGAGSPRSGKRRDHAAGRT